MSCSGWEGAGSLVSLGDALVHVRSCWPPDDDDGIALQGLDERSGQPVGPPIPIDKRGGTLLRATRTPRGLAAVWTRVVAGPVHVRQVAVFAAVDCCPQ
ncbi:MAG: hypothetical protein HY905_11915 [Deltaproteobacteria bacterium]|nr:hypothetical protein [Deltaproteobacteria bacterium]